MARIDRPPSVPRGDDLVVLDLAHRSDEVAGALTSILETLSRRADVLAGRMVQRYRVSIPAYAAMPDETLRQVRELNMRNIVGFIAAMREARGPGPDEIALIRDSATKRAREGIDLSALLAAYRVGAQVAWDEIRSLVGTSDAASLAAGIELATAIMGWVDEVSSTVAQSYLEEYERMSRDREAARRDFIDGLVGGGLTIDEVRARAEALGLDPDQPAAVAVISFAHKADDPSVTRAAMHRVRAQVPDLPVDPVVDAVRGDEIVLLFAATEGTAETVAAELRAILATSAGDVEVVAGVGRPREAIIDLAGSHREAMLALAAARAGASSPVALYGEVLVEELILRERGVSRRLAHTLLDPLAPYPDLKATLIEYINHGPSLPKVARRLFLHPNTVAYRLTRIRELTGRDPKSPVGVSELFLALRAAQLVGDDAPL